jgi:hypothetical protein
MLEKKGSINGAEKISDCEEFTREKNLDLCASCEHSPVVRGKFIFQCLLCVAQSVHLNDILLNFIRLFFVLS